MGWVTITVTSPTTESTVKEREDGSGDEAVEVAGWIAKNESEPRWRSWTEGGGTGLHQEVEERRCHEARSDSNLDLFLKDYM